MNDLQVRVHRTVLCCQSPFLMELVHSTEDGGDTVIIIPDVEVDAMISVLDVLYSGQSSATTDYDKFQLTRLLLRLGLDKVARSLTLQLVTTSEVRDENLNNLEHSEDFKGPAINLPPTQPPPDICNSGTSPDLEVIKDQTEAGTIYYQTQNQKCFDPDMSITIDSPKLTSTPLQSSASQEEKNHTNKERRDIEKEKCVQEINVKMREEFAKLNLKNVRRKNRKQEEVSKSEVSIVQKPTNLKEKKLKSNRRPRNDCEKESDPKLAVLQPYPLRNDCRIALGLRNIVPKAPKGKVHIKPSNFEALPRKSISNGGAKSKKDQTSHLGIDMGSEESCKIKRKCDRVTERSLERTRKMQYDASASETKKDKTLSLPSETQDSSSAPPLGYRKEAGRKTVRVSTIYFRFHNLNT